MCGMPYAAFACPPPPLDLPSLAAPQPRDLDLLFTAETHNFPCAVAPHPGAETGAGGRIRDTHATGRGSLVCAATAGYCVGNLQARRERGRGGGRRAFVVAGPPLSGDCVSSLQT